MEISSDNELDYRTFNEQWETAAEQMRKLANEVTTDD